MIQERVAALHRDRVNGGQSLAGRDAAALAQLLPSSGGGGGAAPLAVQTQMCADLRRPKTLHLAQRSRLIQVHRGFLIPGGNRWLLDSPACDEKNDETCNEERQSKVIGYTTEGIKVECIYKLSDTILMNLSL